MSDERQAPVTTRTRRTVVDVDDRGRVSLAKYGFKSVQVVLDELPGGALSIQRAVVMTEVEAAHYRNPQAVETLQSGFSDLEKGRVSEFKPRSRQARAQKSKRTR